MDTYANNPTNARFGSLTDEIALSVDALIGVRKRKFYATELCIVQVQIMSVARPRNQNLACSITVLRVFSCLKFRKTYVPGPSWLRLCGIEQSRRIQLVLPCPCHVNGTWTGPDVRNLFTACFACGDQLLFFLTRSSCLALLPSSRSGRIDAM